MGTFGILDFLFPCWSFLSVKFLCENPSLRVVLLKDWMFISPSTPMTLMISCLWELPIDEMSLRHKKMTTWAVWQNQNRNPFPEIYQPPIYIYLTPKRGIKVSAQRINLESLPPCSDFQYGNSVEAKQSYHNWCQKWPTAVILGVMLSTPVTSCDPLSGQCLEHISPKDELCDMH